MAGDRLLENVRVNDMKKRFLICLLGLACICGCGNASNTPDINQQTNDDQKDISAPADETSVSVIGFDFTVPEGFTEDPTSPGIWLADDESGANINYNEFPYDENMTHVTADDLKQEMENTLSTQGYDVQVSIDSFEEVKIDGYQGFQIELSYEYATTKIHQLEMVVITPDLAGTIVYSDINQSKYFEQYLTSAKSITVVTSEN